ncbi:unnamed protein product [Tilletia laevis]|uniref:Uncharacterized protein n=1 Tax=Tilletia caries TaxID=13290 RepID=A0A177VE67_9BASI|nr:hypothetical protein CF335_g24 [Tilletia laevis]KAE8265646.1 hypothetical protein A4X03_0g128 [Tilletia caries]CAD6902366.1 unnamed protein product [Tilletia laevis]
MTMTWTGERLGGGGGGGSGNGGGPGGSSSNSSSSSSSDGGKSSNLSHRFRRAVIQGNLPLAQRLAQTAMALSEPAATANSGAFTRPISAAETVRRTQPQPQPQSGHVAGASRVSVTHSEHGPRWDGAWSVGESSNNHDMVTTTSRTMVAGSGLPRAMLAEEEDNPATPTLRSHWALASSPLPPSPLPPSSSFTATAMAESSGAARLRSSSSSSSTSNHLLGRDLTMTTSTTMEDASSAQAALPPSAATASRVNNNKPYDGTSLPPMIRYTREDPTQSKYLTPSERAGRAQRAALDVPFTIRNVDLTSPAGSEGRKASLILALEHGTGVEMVEWLLQMGHEAEGPSTDNDNNSVFALAAIFNRCDVIERYSVHPDVDVPSLVRRRSASEGRTALHWAALKGHDAAIRLLLSLGANKDALDNDHTTPLHFASAWGHITSVQLLKEVGARSDLANKQGFRALDWAYDNNIKIVLENFDEQQQRTSFQSHSYSYSSSSDHGAPMSSRSPVTVSQHLADIKSSGAGSAAELGNVRSLVMSRDQVAMQQYRRALPRQQTTTSSDSRQQRSATAAADVFMMTSPQWAGKTLRGESSRSVTMSPDTLRAGVLSPSPPTSPAVQLAHLR